MRALWRYGGILTQPRTTARSLQVDEGAADGIWLGGLYLLSVGTYKLMEGLATLLATTNLNGLLMLLAALGRVVVVPILVLVACETVLGRDRAYRRGILLVPMVLVSSLAHELAIHGIAIRAYVPEIIGGLVSVLLAWWVRPEIEPQKELA
ncbi:MAG: hypothetical protein AAF799_34800 [Myxococcota bacterium]